MIDLLYTYNHNGPGKVINNLKLGLEKIGIEYRDNPTTPDINNFAVALQWNNNLYNYNPEKLLIGPNVSTLPIDNQFIMNGGYKKLIVPSGWVMDLYSMWISKEKMSIWPVGVDTEKFSDKSKETKQFDCMIYFKRRSLEDLLFIENMLRLKNQTYNTLTYGNYKEEEFIDLISKSRYAIVVDNTESQGIAIQEMMSCGLPLFVWDVDRWVDRGDIFACKASSIPFWDERCGVSVVEKNNIDESFDVFLNKIDFFDPRSYILENLTLEKQAKELTNLFN
ncbi:MAG: glycosyl transferase [Bacteroidia bacterium]|nr:MAG: glycosyl transferase [Bacteroidia bacterium]